MSLELNKTVQPQDLVKLFPDDNTQNQLALAAALVINYVYKNGYVIKKEDFMQKVPYAFCNTEYIDWVTNGNPECFETCTMAYLNSGGRSVNFILASIKKNPFLRINIEKQGFLGRVKRITSINAEKELVDLLVNNNLLTEQ